MYASLANDGLLHYNFFFQPMILKKHNETIKYDDVEPTPTCQEPVDTIKGWFKYYLKHA